MRDGVIPCCPVVLMVATLLMLVSFCRASQGRRPPSRFPFASPFTEILQTAYEFFTPSLFQLKAARFWAVVLYVFNFGMIVGIAFLVLCLQRFSREVRPGHTQPPLTRGNTQPLQVLKPAARRARAREEQSGRTKNLELILAISKSSRRGHKA
jgi:hypothetical protein